MKKTFSKILYIFIAAILLLPSDVFASAQIIYFDPSLTFNNSCKLVVTYDLKIDPSTMTLATPTTPANIFKLAVTPVDPVTNNPQTTLGVDYVISVPADGTVTNGTIQTIFSEYQPYKIQIVEYAQSTFIDALDNPPVVTPAPCESTTGGNTGSGNGNTAGGGSQNSGNQTGNSSGGTASSPSQNQTSFSIDIDNPISVNSIPELIQKILEGLIKIGIPLLVVMIVYSGFLYLVARGDPGKIQSAHTMLTYTLIGGAILVGAWALAQIIHTTLIDITASLIHYFV